MVYRREALRGHVEESFRTSTPLRSRFCAVRSDVTFRLQTIEGGVDSADGYLATSAEFDLLPHRDSIGPVFQPQKRQDDEVLEFAKIIVPSHFLYNIDQINRLWNALYQKKEFNGPGYASRCGELEIEEL